MKLPGFLLSMGSLNPAQSRLPTVWNPEVKEQMLNGDLDTGVDKDQRDSLGLIRAADDLARVQKKGPHQPVSPLLLGGRHRAEDEKSGQPLVVAASGFHKTKQPGTTSHEQEESEQGLVCSHQKSDQRLARCLLDPQEAIDEFNLPVASLPDITVAYLKSLKPGDPSIGLRGSHPDVFKIDGQIFMHMKQSFIQLLDQTDRPIRNWYEGLLTYQGEQLIFIPFSLWPEENDTLLEESFSPEDAERLKQSRIVSQGMMAYLREGKELSMQMKQWLSQHDKINLTGPKHKRTNSEGFVFSLEGREIRAKRDDDTEATFSFSFASEFSTNHHWLHSLSKDHPAYLADFGRAGKVQKQPAFVYESKTGLLVIVPSDMEGRLGFYTDFTPEEESLILNALKREDREAVTENKKYFRSDQELYDIPNYSPDGMSLSQRDPYRVGVWHGRLGCPIMLEKFPNGLDKAPEEDLTVFKPYNPRASFLAKNRNDFPLTADYLKSLKPGDDEDVIFFEGKPYMHFKSDLNVDDPNFAQSGKGGYWMECLVTYEKDKLRIIRRVLTDPDQREDASSDDVLNMRIAAVLFRRFKHVLYGEEPFDEDMQRFFEVLIESDSVFLDTESHQEVGGEHGVSQISHVTTAAVSFSSEGKKSTVDIEASKEFSARNAYKRALSLQDRVGYEEANEQRQREYAVYTTVNFATKAPEDVTQENISGFMDRLARIDEHTIFSGKNKRRKQLSYVGTDNGVMIFKRFNGQSEVSIAFIPHANKGLYEDYSAINDPRAMDAFLKKHAKQCPFIKMKPGNRGLCVFEAYPALNGKSMRFYFEPTETMSETNIGGFFGLGIPKVEVLTGQELEEMFSSFHPLCKRLSESRLKGVGFTAVDMKAWPADGKGALVNFSFYENKEFGLGIGVEKTEKGLIPFMYRTALVKTMSLQGIQSWRSSYRWQPQAEPASLEAVEGFSSVERLLFTKGSGILEQVDVVGKFKNTLRVDFKRTFTNDEWEAMDTESSIDDKVLKAGFDDALDRMSTKPNQPDAPIPSSHDDLKNDRHAYTTDWFKSLKLGDPGVYVAKEADGTEVKFFFQKGSDSKDGERRGLCVIVHGKDIGLDKDELYFHAIFGLTTPKDVQHMKMIEALYTSSEQGQEDVISSLFEPEKLLALTKNGVPIPEIRSEKQPYSVAFGDGGITRVVMVQGGRLVVKEHIFAKKNKRSELLEEDAVYTFQTVPKQSQVEAVKVLSDEGISKVSFEDISFNEVKGFEGYRFFQNVELGFGLALEVGLQADGREKVKRVFTYKAATPILSRSELLRRIVLFYPFSYHDDPYSITELEDCYFERGVGINLTGTGPVGVKDMSITITKEGRLLCSGMNSGFMRKEGPLALYIDAQEVGEEYGEPVLITAKRTTKARAQQDFVFTLGDQEWRGTYFSEERAWCFFKTEEATGPRVKAETRSAKSYFHEGESVFLTAELEGTRVYFFRQEEKSGQEKVGTLDIYGVAKPILNASELKLKKQKKQLEKAVIEFNELTPSNKPQAIPITWPSGTRMAANYQKVADWHVPVFIKSGDPGVDKMKRVKMRLLAGSQKELVVRWGEQGAPSTYRITYEGKRGKDKRILLHPMNGAPQGVFELVFKNGQEAAFVPVGPSEIHTFVFNARHNHKLPEVIMGDDERLTIDFGALAGPVSKTKSEDGVARVLTLKTSKDYKQAIELIHAWTRIYKESLEAEAEPLSWKQEKTTVHQKIALTQLPGQSAKEAFLVNIKRTGKNDGRTDYALEDLSFRGLGVDAIYAAKGFCHINGERVIFPQKIKEGDELTIRKDSDLGWEDCVFVFDGKRFEKVAEKSSFVSKAKHTETSSLTDQAFELELTVVDDQRTGKRHLDQARLKFKHQVEILKSLGLDPYDPPVCSPFSDEIKDGDKIVFSFKGNNKKLGQIEYTLRVDHDGAVTVVRTLRSFTIATFFPESVIVAMGDFEVTIPTETRPAPWDGAVARVFVQKKDFQDKKNLHALKAALDIVGIEHNITEEHNNIQLEVDESGDAPGLALLSGGTISLRPISVNRDGSFPVGDVKLTDHEYAVVRTALDESDFKAAKAGHVEVVERIQELYSAVTDFDIAPHEIFLPTARTIRWIFDLFKGWDRGDGHPFADRQRLGNPVQFEKNENGVLVPIKEERRLEFESPDGLVISIPVMWRHRQRNVFGLDGFGRLFEEGERRIETYVRGRERQTRSPVPYHFRAHEDGGYWTLYVMVKDQKDEVARKAFNLKLVIHKDSPVLCCLINRLDEQGDDNMNVWPGLKEKGSKAIEERVSSVLRRKNIPYPDLYHLPTQVLTKAEESIQLHFTSRNGEAYGDIAELSGIKLGRTGQILHFSEELALTVYPEDGGAERVIRLQHSFSKRRRVILLREINDDGSLGRTYEWNIILKTLVLKTKSDPQGVAEDEFRDLLRSRDVPYRTPGKPQAGSPKKPERVRDKNTATIAFETGEPIPLLPEHEKAVVIPFDKEVESITDPKRIREILKILPLHDFKLLPSEHDLHRFMLAGEEFVYITFVSSEGVVLQIPMVEACVEDFSTNIDVNQYIWRYVFDKEADSIWGVKKARLLLPKREEFNPIVKALINKAYADIPLLAFRDYQQEGLQLFLEDYLTAAAPNRQGTIGLATGAGKTIMAMGAFALALKDYKKGDKLIFTTHLKDLSRQALEVFEKLFASVFKAITGEDLKIGIIAGAGKPDFDGQLLLVSVPKVNAMPHGRFKKELRKSLGSNGKILLNVMDEFHHKEATTWKNYANSVRSVSSEVYTLGLTATPKDDDPHVFFEKSAFELMTDGALPNGYLVEVDTGIHLRSDTVRAGRQGSVSKKGMLKQLKGSPKRQRIIMESVAEFAIRKNNNGGLAPILMGALDIQDAINLGAKYADYFSFYAGSRRLMKQVAPLRARRVEMIGTHADKRPFTKEEILEAFERKRRGEVDAFVAVVHGEMSPDARALIESAWKLEKENATDPDVQGFVEVVVADELYKEGYDGKHIQTIVGSDTTQSLQDKTQRGGRGLRFGEGEYDVHSGRVFDQKERVLIDFKFSGNHDVKMFRNGFGYHKVIPANTVWNMLEDSPADAVSTYWEVPITVKSKRTGGRASGVLELDICLTSKKRKSFSLREVVQTDNHGNKHVIGLHILKEGDDESAKVSPNAQKAMNDLVAFTGMDLDPQIKSEEALEDEGLSWLWMNNGGRFQMEIAKGEAADYLVKGINVRPARGDRDAVAYLTYFTPEDEEISFEVYKPFEEASILYLRNSRDDTWYVAAISKNGEFWLWERNQYIKDYLVYQNSASYPMGRIVDGAEYSNQAQSRTIRKPVRTLPGMRASVEFLHDWGRESGSTRMSSMKGTKNDNMHVRFIVSEELGTGDLKLTIGAIEDGEDGFYFPFRVNNDSGMAQDFDYEIIEDKWVDVHGVQRRGKVKIVVYQKAYVHTRTKRDGTKHSELKKPYGWIEYENREAFLGAAVDYRELRGHAHESGKTYKTYKVMPSQEGFLFYGAGLLINRDNHEMKSGKRRFVGKGLFSRDNIDHAAFRFAEMKQASGVSDDVAFKMAADTVDEIYLQLSMVTDASHADKEYLLRALSMLTYLGYQEAIENDNIPHDRKGHIQPLLDSESGDYQDTVMAELARFALEHNREKVPMSRMFD